ncbi:MAG: AI-2E family transporter [Planctomycetes bacterium]|nr:AI-2E family transporter [Planctomycetota bacterium]
MAKKKKKPGGNPGGAKPPAASSPQKPPADESRDTVMLPAPLKQALKADYSQVLRMRNVQWLIVIGAVFGALLLGYYLSAVFVPLLVAMSLAYILDPLVQRLVKRGVKRTRAVLLIFIAFLAIGVAAGAWFAASVVSDVQSLSTQMRGLWDELKSNQSEWVASWNEMAPTNSMKLDEKEDTFGQAGQYVIDSLFPTESEVEAPEAARARAEMAGARADLLATFQTSDTKRDLVLDASEIGADNVKRMDSDGNGSVSTDEWFVAFGATPSSTSSRTISDTATSATSTVLGVVGTGLVGLLTLLMFVVLVPIYTWYFMVGWPKVIAKGREYLPGVHKPRIERILKEIDAMLKAFFRGRMVIVFIITVLTTVVYLAFGVQYAVLFGMLGGLGILIPYAAMVISWVPAMAIMAINGEPLWAIIAMSACFHGIQALEQFVLAPKLLGDAVELHAVTILVGVFVMASLFGLFGALLAVPLTAIAKTLGREFLLPYFRSLAAEKPRAASDP